MANLASGRKHGRDESVDSNALPATSKAICTGTRNTSQRSPDTNSAVKSALDTPFTEHTNHTKGHTVPIVLLNHLDNNRRVEAQMAINNSIITHKLLQVVRPRKRTMVNKAQRISANITASLETYINSQLKDNSTAAVPGQERVRRFCAPHNESAARFSEVSEMYSAIGALFEFIFKRIQSGKNKDTRNIIRVFGQNDFPISNGNISMRIDKALRIDFSGIDELKVGDAETKDKTVDMLETTTYKNIFAVIEAKVDNQAKVVDDANPEDMTNSRQRIEATVLLYFYTHDIYFRQHARRFAWGFTVCGSVFQACLFTHDIMVRSGGIDVATKHGRRELVELLTNMSFCDSDQLGYDPTIFFSETNKRWEMNVFENGQVYRCAINYVSFGANSVFGRHTRCFRCTTIPEGNSKEKPRVVLVKDAWAYQKRGMNKREDVRNEAALLRVISDGFCNDFSLANKYPDLWAGGNVQQTGSYNTTNDDTTDHIFAVFDQDEREKIPHRVHKRLAVAHVGGSLYMAEIVDETIIAVADAMEVYMAAWAEHGIMHRDISTNNILFRCDPTTGKFLNGALIDFDCAIQVTDNEPQTERQSYMTGTFPFMSINCLAASSDSILRNGCVPRTILDDWESVLYVLCWLGTFGISHYDFAARERNGQGGELPICGWQTGSPEKAARVKMNHLASIHTFNRNVLERFYEPPLMQSSSSEPSPSACLSYKPLKELVATMWKTLFENKNISKLGWGTGLGTDSGDLFGKVTDDSDADIPAEYWDAYLDLNDRNPFSRRAQIADKIGNALFEVMAKARSEARERLEIRSAEAE